MFYDSLSSKEYCDLMVLRTGSDVWLNEKSMCSQQFSKTLSSTEFLLLFFKHSLP